MGPREPLTSPSSLVSSWAQLRKSSYLAKGTTGSGSSRRYSFSREATVCTSVVLQTEGTPVRLGTRELQGDQHLAHPPQGRSLLSHPCMCVYAHTHTMMTG